MNSIWWFIAGLVTGWLVTCLAIGISVSDNTRIGRLLRRLGVRLAHQSQRQNQASQSQPTKEHQQQDKW
jgi:hypothetical protein